MKNKKEIDNISKTLLKLDKKGLAIIYNDARVLDAYINYEHEGCSDKEAKESKQTA